MLLQNPAISAIKDQRNGALKDEEIRKRRGGKRKGN